MFIGSEEEDENISVTKTLFIAILAIFLHEMEKFRKNGYKIMMDGDDGKIEFTSIVELKKEVYLTVRRALLGIFYIFSYIETVTFLMFRSSKISQRWFYWLRIV